MLIESVTFKLAPGVDEADFLAADARLQTDFAYTRPGMVRRTTARAAGGSGGWLVLTLWGSAADADAAWAAADDDPAAQAVATLVDPATMAVARYTSLD